MKKLLLTAPNWADYREPANNPISILDLAPVARAAGWEVECHYLGDVIAHAGPDDYDMVGVSVLSGYSDLFKDLQALSNNYLGTDMVVGGKWTQGLSPEEIIRVERLGAEVWTGSGEAFFGAPADLSHYPSWNAVDLEWLDVRGSGLMTSRGCPYHCAFCHNTEKRVAFFPARRTADNIELLFERGVERVFFVDDIFTLNIGHMRAVYEECAGRRIPLAGRNMFFTHVNHVRPEPIKIMKVLAPACVQIGIESGDDRMLGAMRKGFTAEEALAAVRRLHEAGLPVRPLFLIGFPGETVESLNNTEELARAMRPFTGRPWVSFYQPIPGTEGYRLAQRQGSILRRDNDNTKVAYLEEGLTRGILVAGRNRIMGV